MPTPTKETGKKLSCRDIILELRHIDKQIKELKKEQITEKKKEAAIKKLIQRAADTVDSLGLEVEINKGKRGKKGKIRLHPSTSKAARGAIKTYEAWEEYQRAGGEIPPLEEALDFLKKLKDTLRKEYNKKCRRWKGEISCIISVSGTSMPSVILEELTWHEEQKWKITGKLENITDATFADSTYPALWTATQTGKWIWHDSEDPTYRGTYIFNGQAQHASSITIKIVGNNYTLMTPQGKAENALAIDITLIMPGVGTQQYSITHPLAEDAQTIEGKLQSGGLIITGAKGPISNPPPFFFSEDPSHTVLNATWTKTLEWRLSREEEDSPLFV